MLMIVAVLSFVTVVLSLFALFRNGAEGTFTSVALSISSFAGAVWVAVDLVPAYQDTNRIVASLALSSLVASGVFWARSAVHARRRSSAMSTP
jgi:hypothetical protein